MTSPLAMQEARRDTVIGEHGRNSLSAKPLPDTRKSVAFRVASLNGSTGKRGEQTWSYYCASHRIWNFISGFQCLQVVVLMANKQIHCKNPSVVCLC